MGQYYKPINIDKKQFVYSHDYGNGLKLMEHSWIGNAFVGAVESLLVKGGAWYMDRIVWGGDYADREIDEFGNTLEYNLYGSVDDDDKIRPNIPTRKFRYVVNLDTREFVDKNKIPVSEYWEDPKTGKKYPYTIHPLPILTCEGNGRGGGDYHGNSPLIGKWARQRVIVSSSKPKNCKELIFDLIE